MAQVFAIKQNDTSPAIQATCRDANGDPIDLTGASIKFHMKAGNGDLKVDGVASIVAPAVAGVVNYSWVAADTDTVGTFQAEFEVTYTDATIETFPNQNNIRVRVADDIA